MQSLLGSLFLAWVTKRPVAKQSLARCLKHVLVLAGIDNYASHSYRGPGLSNAFAKGVTHSQIVLAGDWTNAQTSHRFYNKPSDSSSVGRIILDGREYSNLHIIICLTMLYAGGSLNRWFPPLTSTCPPKLVMLH